MSRRDWIIFGKAMLIVAFPLVTYALLLQRGVL